MDVTCGIGMTVDQGADDGSGGGMRRVAMRFYEILQFLECLQ